MAVISIDSTPETIKILENALEEAHSGRLEQIFLLAIDSEGDVFSGIHGEDGHALLCALDLAVLNLKMSLLQSCQPDNRKG